MNYRSFPGGEESLSILGFGCMRLPLKSDNSKDIDTALARRMIRYAVDQGVNYIDTAYPYHQGASEPFVADALSGGYREKVYLATKLPSWNVDSHADFDRYLDEQLERLRTDHIDYYLIHALDKDRWEKMVECDIFSFMDRAVADGRVRHIGFSFHDDLETFKKIVDAYQWHFCQIQYNYLDTHMQAGEEGLAYAYERGIGIIVMEPLRGGGLTGTLPEDIAAVWQGSPQDWSPAEWALRWIWNDPRVTVVLSGMSDMEQTEENVAVAADAGARVLESDELEAVGQAKRLYEQKIEVPCTSCGYCMPCPHGVNIPEAFRFYNNARMFVDIPKYRREYLSMVGGDQLAHMCAACGECEPKCPQHIPIIDSLREVSEAFSLEEV